MDEEERMEIKRKKKPAHIERIKPLSAEPGCLTEDGNGTVVLSEER
jgi:hypothetical protein